ncbi:TPA: hypothetical protein QIF63_000139 [Enterobacter asburiae]|nr:hypothetical protein [Enterobacter asburiae]
MHRIDTPTAQADKFGQGKNGFTNGDPATGRRATDLNSDMWDAVQEEICTAIESAGLTLDKTKHDQLYQAIVKIITSKIPDALLRQNNLSDVVDKALARGNLELGSAATKNVGTNRGDVLQQGAWGIGTSVQDSAAGSTHVSKFMYEPFQSGTLYPDSVCIIQSGGPTPTEWGQIAISYGANFRIFAGHGIYNNQPEITELYHDKRKPTSSDVGAYPITGGKLNGNLQAIGYVQSGKGYDVVSSQDIWAARSIYENGLRVYSPNNKPSTASLAVNGWEKDLATGVITQWGRGLYSDGQLVNFPIAFPNAAFAVSISSNPYDNAALAELAQAYPVSNSQFRTGCATFSGGNFVSSSLNCTWIAKGY